jgi:hypothetical protein
MPVLVGNVGDGWSWLAPIVAVVIEFGPARNRAISSRRLGKQDQPIEGLFVGWRL